MFWDIKEREERKIIILFFLQVIYSMKRYGINLICKSRKKGKIMNNIFFE